MPRSIDYCPVCREDCLSDEEGRTMCSCTIPDSGYICEVCVWPQPAWTKCFGDVCVDCAHDIGCEQEAGEAADRIPLAHTDGIR